jgi:hypothetical protein
LEVERIVHAGAEVDSSSNRGSAHRRDTDRRIELGLAQFNSIGEWHGAVLPTIKSLLR